MLTEQLSKIKIPAPVLIGAVMTLAPIYGTVIMYKDGVDGAIAFAKERKNYEARIEQLEQDVDDLFQDLDRILKD